MDLTVVHVLSLTPFEAALPARTYQELLTKDYPIHSFYFPKTGKTLELGFAYKSNFQEKMQFINDFAAAAGIKLKWENEVRTN